VSLICEKETHSNKACLTYGKKETHSNYVGSTPKVDVEELKRQLRRKVLGDLRPILEAQGI
jgi:hypothetical protein